MRIRQSARIRAAVENGCISGEVWLFQTKRFRISLEITQDHHYRYDGDDESGEVQDKLDSGEYVAFDSKICVELDGEEIAADYLGASVYSRDTIKDFWTAHRDSDPMNRNCSLNHSRIVHYFPDMVAQAITEARERIAAMHEKLPRMRVTA